MKMTTQIYVDATAVATEKFNLEDEVQVQLEMDEGLWYFYEYDMFRDLTDDDVINILCDTQIEEIMKYITVDKDSLEFNQEETIYLDDGMVCYDVSFDFNIEAFMEKHSRRDD